MATKLDLLVVPGPTVSPAIAPTSGHVLAAFLRGDASGPVPEVSALVGSGLFIRDAATGDTKLTLGAQHLAVRSIDLRDDVLMTPRTFVLEDNLPEIGRTPAAAPVTLNGSSITVTLAAAAPEGGATVWVYIEGGPQPVVHRVEVPEFLTTPPAAEPLLLPPGTYRVLVLAPGHQSVVTEQVVT